jgi:hypothetical protein
MAAASYQERPAAQEVYVWKRLFMRPQNLKFLYDEFAQIDIAKQYDAVTQRDTFKDLVRGWPGPPAGSFFGQDVLYECNKLFIAYMDDVLHPTKLMEVIFNNPYVEGYDAYSGTMSQHGLVDPFMAKRGGAKSFLPRKVVTPVSGQGAYLAMMNPAMQVERFKDLKASKKYRAQDQFKYERPEQEEFSTMGNELYQGFGSSLPTIQHGGELRMERCTKHT